MLFEKIVFEFVSGLYVCGMVLVEGCVERMKLLEGDFDAFI
jgi:hypothetical protein